jgi:hypothetical protein
MYRTLATQVLSLNASAAAEYMAGLSHVPERRGRGVLHFFGAALGSEIVAHPPQP